MLARLALVVACLAGAARAQEAAPAKPVVHEQVTVSADRGMGAVSDEATSAAVLSSEQLKAVPALALDDSLHAVAGFQLFRRTSSWTANPTSSGVSLRGLGSTAASRTLVVSDEVSANDAFGGWVHWDEIPTPAVSAVELLRGGASDLYGSSAIGGVIDIVPRRGDAAPLLIDADAMGAQEDTAGGDALVSAASPRVGSVLGAFSALSNGGYITTAPAVRGPIDLPTDVADEAARVELRTPTLAGATSMFLRGNVLNEARVNGTPEQNNAARLWRYVAGLDDATKTSTATVRVFGSREGYRQSFSSINAARTAETLTKVQHVPSDELGAAVQGSHAFGDVLTALGADVRDVRATDDEMAPATGVTTATSAHQRAVGGFAEALWQSRGWSLSGSVRVDSFRTFDARQTVSSAGPVTQLPTLAEMVASPHAGVVRKLPHGVSLTATAFRAFRGPTLNELYRSSQVGQQLTLANNSLLAERATGAEGGVELAGRAGQVRAAYFWTEINRPISAVQIAATATTQTLQRENLGQIQSRGMMVEAQSARWHSLAATFGYQLAVATVTAFNASSAAQPPLVGKWIPEVPRQSVTADVNYTPKWISLHALASYEGMEFDDAANTFVLHPYARVDLSAERRFGRGFALFVGAQNVLNRSIDAGRTPLLTLAPPRLVQGGLRYNFSR